MEGFPQATALVVAGGVASNGAIWAALAGVAESRGLKFVAPPLWLCTDNAAMIAWAGAERLALGLIDTLEAPARPRWPLDPGAERCVGRGSGMIGVIGGGAWGTALAQVMAAQEDVAPVGARGRGGGGDQSARGRMRCFCRGCGCTSGFGRRRIRQSWRRRMCGWWWRRHSICAA